MSVFLTPELKPFFGGTYFPPDGRYGRPGFKDILTHIAKLWANDRERILQSTETIVEQLSSFSASRASSSSADRLLFENPYQQIRRSFDSVWGGFGSAPKFPRPVVYNYLLRLRNPEADEMVFSTLRHMARGGMHDQLGGGFHRYSVDERWFVPHFEKMLYDQAQLAVSYLEAHQLTADPSFAETARGIFTYVLRDLRDPAGVFYSAEDADSPDPDDPSHSGEGAFYIWSWREIEQLLGAQLAPVFAHHYGVERNGNVESDPQSEFVHRNILFVADDAQDERLAHARRILFEARAQRPRPHLDNKVLTSWNALMISAFAKGYAVLHDRLYQEVAVTAIDFLLARMYDPATGRLFRRYSENEAAIDAFLDDYAFFAQALLDVFEITFELRYLETALDLATRGFALFEDTENGGFFSTKANAPGVLLRMKDDYDGAEPSGNSVAADVLIRLARLTGNESLEKRAQPPLSNASTASPQMLVALGRHLAPPAHTILRVEKRDARAEAALWKEWEKFEPYTSVLLIDDQSMPRWSQYSPVRDNLERKGALTIYRCRNYTCDLPEVIA